MSTVQRIADHLSEYVARYTVLVIVVLTPLAGALGEVAAKLGGVDTQAGRAVLGAASALAAIIAGATFLNNLGRWQIAERQRVAALVRAEIEAANAGK